IKPPSEKDEYRLYKFDPTSLSKITPLLYTDFSQVMIVMDKKGDVVSTISNIRMQKPQLRIALVDQWNLELDDANIVVIKSDEVLSNRLLNYLPDVPVTAQNVGLGIGEMMEVLVPFGSSYVYRHIGTIRQKNWRIVAIYRNNKMMLANADSMIQPNDRLLIMGEPPVLKSVYKAIKRQLGQFPAPFGKNLYLFMDLARLDTTKTRKLLQKALFLHQKFSHKLFIRIINPGNLILLDEIKSFDSEDVNIAIDYRSWTSPELIEHDVEAFNIGLVMVNSETFGKKSYRKALYQTQVPILKIAESSIEDLQEALVAISDRAYVNNDLEKITTSIYDISSQLGLKMTLFDFIHVDDDSERAIIEHFKNLSDIFSKKFDIVQSELNPIRSLKRREDFLQCIPFNEVILLSRWKSLLSTDMHKLYHKLDEYHQIFIPTRI
ncbi:MAG: potassium transporter TrkA, partial [Thiovulaceae bacterium]|nr:potassium transporter TrkA [Sulfurimonadaceae bacterium]